MRVGEHIKAIRTDLVTLKALSLQRGGTSKTISAHAREPGIPAGEHAEGARVRVDHGGADDGLPRQRALLGERGADSAEGGTGAFGEGQDKFSDIRRNNFLNICFVLPLGHLPQPAGDPGQPHRRQRGIIPCPSNLKFRLDSLLLRSPSWSSTFAGSKAWDGSA